MLENNIVVTSLFLFHWTTVESIVCTLNEIAFFVFFLIVAVFYLTLGAEKKPSIFHAFFTS